MLYEIKCKKSSDQRSPFLTKRTCQHFVLQCSGLSFTCSTSYSLRGQEISGHFWHDKLDPGTNGKLENSCHSFGRLPMNSSKNTSVSWKERLQCQWSTGKMPVMPVFEMVMENGAGRPTGRIQTRPTEQSCSNKDRPVVV